MAIPDLLDRGADVGGVTFGRPAKLRPDQQLDRLADPRSLRDEEELLDELDDRARPCQFIR